MLWFEIAKTLIAVSVQEFTVSFIIIFGTLSFPVVYSTERQRLCTTRWAWHSSSRGSICVSRGLSVVNYRPKCHAPALARMKNAPTKVRICSTCGVHWTSSCQRYNAFALVVAYCLSAGDLHSVDGRQARGRGGVTRWRRKSAVVNEIWLISWRD